MFEDLKKNLAQEKKIVADMRAVAIGFTNDSANRDFYASSLRALAEQLDILNNTVPELLKEWSPFVEGGPKLGAKVIKKLNPEIEEDTSSARKKVSVPTQKNMVKMSYVSPSTKKKTFITLNKEDKGNFLKKLKLGEDALKNINSSKSRVSSKSVRKPNAYAVFSSKYFGTFSDKLSQQFGEISKDLKNANIPILLTSYLSMAIMSSVIAFTIGLLIFIILMVISLSN